MKTDLKIWDIVAGLLLAAALVLLAAAFTKAGAPGDVAGVAGRVERVLERRLAKLDAHLQTVLEQNPSEWMDAGKLPQDMVVYRYVEDTLQSWAGRFPVMNDALVSGQMFQSLANPRIAPDSPLAKIGEELSYINLGPKWYLAKSVVQGNVRLIAGLELQNTASAGPFNGINPRLGLGENYILRPLTASGGEAVSIGGRPLLKLIYASFDRPLGADPRLLLLSLALALAAAIALLCSHRTLRMLAAVLSVSLSGLVFFYFWGRGAGSDVMIFSPAIYADGNVFYSLGGLLIINTAMTLFCLSLYIVRKEIFENLRSRTAIAAWLVWVLITLAAALIYTATALRSIALNSNISLEIYKIRSFGALSAFVYLSFIIQLTCLPLLAQLLEPLRVFIPRFRINSFGLNNRIGTAVLLATFLVGVTATLGFRKEKASLEVWAGRLAVSRDIPLEVQLLTAEERLASDPVVASLSVLQDGGAAIRGYLSESYFSRVMQEHDVAVSLSPDAFAFPSGTEPIAAGSRFSFSDQGDGFVDYFAVFSYRLEGYGLTRVYIKIERNGAWRHRGYASILGHSLPGEVLIPAQYSFARYQGDKLLTYRGTYAYPLRLSAKRLHDLYEDEDSYSRQDRYAHFIYKVAPDELVVVSRPVIGPINYLIALLFLGLVFFFVFSLFSIGKKEGESFGQNYFQSRITGLIMIALLLTLVSLASVSVYFVYNRNEANQQAMMSGKINSIQASLSARLRGISTTQELRTPEVLRVLEDVADNNSADITLYSPGGMVLMSSAPAVFDQMLVDARMSEDAFLHIITSESRYYIQRERLGRVRYYAMYAPLIGAAGTPIAIICSPYTDDSYDFKTNAVTHSIMILSLFIFLLMLTRFLTKRVLALMFKPLEEMGREMAAADLESLEHIRYDKQDEISSLVSAYNRMVDELSESSRKLAQAERDKAWSGMARQVAHEIKNPLTPMKLQLQRLIRLKSKGDDSWQEKFDEMASVLLDHIDILTETANQFSSFAKLYTEEPVPIELSSLLQEEIAMFDNKDGLVFEYLGLPQADVMGPKPQLTRVFVNLINNSVQALEGRDDGRILVQLRNSVQDGFYDIVFEDNGPGVDEENVGKLFTPNFTTKNGGSGLGLAISRSILEKCGASISYSRSFSLGGACFTILYPKN